MSKAESFTDKLISDGGGCALITPLDECCNQSAEASRFHRASLAICCILSVLLNEPMYLYPVVFSTFILVIFSSRFEPFMLFYKYVMVKIIGRDPWPISEEVAGRYLMGRLAEKINCSSVGIIILAALALKFFGLSIWVVPVAVIAAGISLAATTGVCLIGILTAKIEKLFS